MVHISVLASRELQPVIHGGSRDSQQEFQQIRPRLASRVASSRASRTAPDHATKIA
ncbi:hypothetical protein J7E83_09710 [Arthrobacter sp. ISL-48]|uniref:hypothetical protein n=1 Tax=Arthrobacter sp. ISL-48 TaxID=2819110 RepID=UPI001BE58439|nr:hypothetical protein [Arthrobacter sp. ISL-48]MBT2532399.1 hypothetical protein [Arthrobacter sp. ISL-48]